MTTDIDTTEITTAFFARYADALLARDEQAVADLYAVPALILFPGQAIAVSDRDQTAAFFASSWDQYEGTDVAEPRVVIMGTAIGTVWADVSWDHGRGPAERFCYQLVEREGDWRIAVLTPMELSSR